MDIHGYRISGQSSLIKELTQGMELAKQLNAHMGPEYSVQTKQMLLQQIVSSYDKALFILGWGGASEQPHQLLPVSLPVSLPVMPSSPASTMGSPKCDDLSSVPMNLSCPKFPISSFSPNERLGRLCSNCMRLISCRSYYRCTHRNAHNCWATKQVQRSDEDPTVFDVTYKGKHTCAVDCRSMSAPTSPAKQKAKPDDDLPNMEYQQDSTTALSFLDAPIANTQNIDSFSFSWPGFGSLNSESPHFPHINNTDNICGSFSPSLISPSTSSSNFFSMSPCVTDTLASFQYQQPNLESDIAEMLSVAILATNSPAIEEDFPLDTWNFNTNLPFNNL